MLVERVERPVLSRSQVLELRAGCGVEGFVGVFVADLPADDVGIVAEAARELRRRCARQNVR